jgi:hypothetical protein
MAKPETKTNPNAILAHARLLRLTDRLLSDAEELREARDQLDAALKRHSANAASEGRWDE